MSGAVRSGTWVVRYGGHGISQSTMGTYREKMSNKETLCTEMLDGVGTELGKRGKKGLTIVLCTGSRAGGWGA